MPKQDPRRAPPETERRPAGLLDQMDQIEARRAAKAASDSLPVDGEPATAEGKKGTRRELDLDDVW